MVEVIADVVMPIEFYLPQVTTTKANLMSGATLISGCLIYNITLNKAEVFTGTQWETITSVAR